MLHRLRRVRAFEQRLTRVRVRLQRAHGRARAHSPRLSLIGREQLEMDDESNLRRDRRAVLARGRPLRELLELPMLHLRNEET